MKVYKRDKRSPKPSLKYTSKVMSSIKGKNTKPEMMLRKALFACGIKGYRLHTKDLPGKPDLVFNKSKTIIFVNGCFWHRCPICQLAIPKHNTSYWQTKFNRNVLRDKEKQYQLTALGWKVIVVWECELKSELDQVIHKIKSQLD